MDDSPESESTAPETPEASDAPEPPPPPPAEPPAPTIGEPEPPAPEPPPPEQSLASIVPIGRHEPIDGICGRIDVAPSLAVVLHAPSGNRAMSEELGMRRVARHAEASGRTLAVATRSGVLARRARDQGVPVSWNPRKVHWGSGGKVVIGLGSFALLVPPFGRYAQYVALAVFILAAAALLFTAVPSATVKVYPRTQTVEGVTVARASPRIDEIDLDRMLLPATTVTVERDVLLAVPTTGEVIQGVAPATATLRITNPTELSRHGACGRRRLRSPGLRRLRVRYPRHGSGRRERLRARDRPLPRLRRQRRCRRHHPVAKHRSGGPQSPPTPTPPLAAATMSSAPSPPADIRALESLAGDVGEGPPPGALLTNARPGYGIILRSATVTVELGEPSARAGAAADVVFMEVRTTFEALAIAPEVLDTLARALLAAPGGPGELVPGTVLGVETGNLQVDHPDGSFTGELRVSAEFPLGPSPAEVEDAVGGRSPSAAEAELATRYGIDDVEIDLTPGWAPRLPRFGFRLDIQFASRAFEPEDPRRRCRSQSV